MLTKKHFKAITQLIKESTCKTHNPDFEYLNKKQLVSNLADYLITQNPRFNASKFLQNAIRSK